MLRLVVGLGNPTPTYKRTRHNVGRDFVDALCGTDHLSDFRTQGQVEVTKAFEPNDIFVLKSLSFMNESGPALLGFMKKKGIKPEEILVIVDEFMIPFGTLRLGLKGSAGGHNGMKSIIEVLGTQEFKRLRVGIGPVPDGQDPADFVLRKFTPTEQNALPRIFDAIRTCIQLFHQEGFEKAATLTNKNHLDPS